jgi:hypothetical protein
MANKKVQTRPKPDKAATERLAEHLAELPGEIARARAHVADADDRLRYIAAALEPAIHEFSADDHPDRIRAAATQIRANVVAAAGVLLDLAVFTGRLEGLAWWDSKSGAGE